MLYCVRMRRMSRVKSSQANRQDERLVAAALWLDSSAGIKQKKLVPVTGDASLRRYFRVHTESVSWILMDAPPGSEDITPFVHVDSLLRTAGLHAPEIIAIDHQQGFILLEDLGDDLYRDLITDDSADSLFSEAFATLLAMATSVDSTELPAYNRNRLTKELELFPDWWLGRHLGIELSCSQHDTWEAMCTRLLRSAEDQPQVFVHRDFHSCNLLKTSHNSPGIIDFQDAVCGPLSYDLVSLLWDRYISWPRNRLEGWIETFRQQSGIKINAGDWLRICDWMSLQRNLKVVGIFSRLAHRDHKPGYLEMIPRFWSYLIDSCERYPEFAAFRGLLEELKCAP